MRESARRILLLQPIKETICSHLSPNDCNNLRLACNLSSLRVPIIVGDKRLTSLIGICEETAQLPEIIREFGARKTLIRLAGTPHLRMIQLMIASGYDFNTPYYRYTALQMAARCSQKRNFEFLLKISKCDLIEYNALFSRACYYQNFGSINTFYEMVSVNFPLQFEAGSIADHLEICETLLKLGADVNTKFEYGSTGLTYATQCNSIPTVQMLLAWGADPRIQSVYQENALDYAVELKRQEIVEIFRKLVN